MNVFIHSTAATRGLAAIAVSLGLALSPARATPIQPEHTAKIWREITSRVRDRIDAFVGECTRQTRFIRYRAGRGKPHLKEYRLRKYVIKEWNAKVQPLGTLTLTDIGVKFTPIIDWDTIASRLD